MNSWAQEYLIKSAAGVDTTGLLEKLAGLGAALARSSAAATKRMAGKSWNPASKLNIAGATRSAPKPKPKVSGGSKPKPKPKSKSGGGESKPRPKPKSKGGAGGEEGRKYGLGAMGLAGAGGLGLGLGAGLLARGRSDEAAE